MILLIRVPDMKPVQESSIIRRIHCQIAGRPRCSCSYLSEALSPTIRERFHYTHVFVAPWTSPVNHEFMV